MPKIIRLVYDRSGRRGIKGVPELERYPAEFRGQVWLDAVGKTLMTPKGLLLTLLPGCVLFGLFSFASKYFSREVTGLAFGLSFPLVMLVVRPIIMRAARERLEKMADNPTRDADAKK